ncbi:DUF2971 domain-containing protein [Clostridium perfringens]|uniref:DUF2971 domain-containing protein n=1 Tax=Clostridium perfringens TaxID=1502 RepID=UPI002248689B|nr:DUF2971 domain-containing protein [Clostridium perfringens]MCX0395475.1 DUF2971 domain-containing protein [Clostridium perfringens]
MEINEWKQRIAERGDLTRRLIHLTKEKDGKDAVENLVKILIDRKLDGSGKEGFIVGEKNAVCLQECPLYSLSQNIYYEKKMRREGKYKKVRYRGVGLMFEKTDVYKKGGRPVIYDKTEDAKKYLPKEQWWRIVNLDLSDPNKIIDWTHEREWRVPNQLNFNLSEVTIILGSTSALRELNRLCKRKNIDFINEVKGIVNINDLFY